MVEGETAVIPHGIVAREWRRNPWLNRTHAAVALLVPLQLVKTSLPVRFKNSPFKPEGFELRHLLRCKPVSLFLDSALATVEIGCTN
jgi:hypothetical protein